MAKDKKNRKSSRHFNLEKPVGRVFEIEKDIDLVDVAPTKPEASKPQPATPIAPSKGPENVKKPSSSPKVEETKKPEETTSSYNSGDDTSEEKSSKWKWLIPAAIVVAAVPSYFLFSGNDDTPSEDQIVATAPDAGQNNANGDATHPNAAAGESDNTENVAGSDGSGDVDNTGGSGTPSGSESIGSSDNSSGSGNAGSTSSGAKSSTPQSSNAQSSSNNKTTSFSSNSSVGSSSEKTGETESLSPRGASEPGDSKNYSTSGNPVILGSIEQKALDVIRGIYGNGQVRKDKLGAEYAEIQKIVNEMYRNGTIKKR